MKYIKTTYNADGTIRREVVGVAGEDCLRVSEPFNRHLPEGYVVTPTAEFYEEAQRSNEVERQKEGESQ